MVIACLMASMTYAQEEGGMDDAARVEISAYMDNSSPIPANARKVLKDKMQKIITKNGLGNISNGRFIMTASVRELNLEKSETAPVIYIYTLEVNLFIGDGIEGTLFSSCSSEVSGAGDTKEKAYMAALKKVNVPKTFIEKGKEKIVDYYTAKCDFIISEAQTLAKKQNFDQALSNLMAVPSVCKDCYEKCMKVVEPIYKEKIEVEGAMMLAEAKALWSAGLDMEAAQAAGFMLAQINPASSSYPGAIKLTEEIDKRIREVDQREWDFHLKKEQDIVDLAHEAIKAGHSIRVNLGETQKPQDYKTNGWE